MTTSKHVKGVQQINRTFAEHMKLIRMGYVPKPDDPRKWQLIAGPRIIRNLDGVLGSIKALVRSTCFKEYKS